jgi:ribonuclease T1
MSGGRAVRILAGLLVVAAGAILLFSGADDKSGGTTTATDATGESAAAIPAEQRAAVGEVLRLIDAGGPFPYDEDGAVFSNREGLLPDQPSGYYHEYTVETPGSPDRGARRLVTGENDEVYYTSDHYGSFVKIDPSEFQ